MIEDILEVVDNLHGSSLEISKQSVGVLQPSPHPEEKKKHTFILELVFQQSEFMKANLNTGKSSWKLSAAPQPGVGLKPSDVPNSTEKNRALACSK